MRRREREIRDPAQILDIIGRCGVCRLAFTDGEAPYIVPLNFGYEYEAGALTLYFHCAREGKKLDLLRKNPNAGFEMDCAHRLITGKTACACTMAYQSVIGSGTVSLAETDGEKRHGLSLLMKQMTGETDCVFEDAMLVHVAVLKLTVRAVTAKSNLKEP